QVMRPTEDCWHEPNGCSVQSSLVVHCWFGSFNPQLAGAAGTTHSSALTRCGRESPHLTHPDGAASSVKPCISGAQSGPSVSELPPVVSPVALLPGPSPVVVPTPVVSPVV